MRFVDGRVRGWCLCFPRQVVLDGKETCVSSIMIDSLKEIIKGEDL